MDQIVKAALKKWPSVPHCYGWLALDTRGDWYMRDAAAQAAGAFPRPKGSRIVHDNLVQFIGRNYAADDDGCWYFQNGPQCVYVELEAAPWVWRLQSLASAAPRITSHTGLPAAFESAWLDEFGRLFLGTDRGLGIVHTLDMEPAADAIESGAWAMTEVEFATLPQRFDFRLQPTVRR